MSLVMLLGSASSAPPTIVSQTLLADGVTIRCVPSVPLTAGDAVGLTRSVGTITSASVVDGNLDIVVPKAYAGDAIGTLTYDGTGTLAGATGAVAAFGPVAITNNSEQVAPVACVYPLDDDGTIATAFGYIYAGPAVGADSQSMDYTSAGAGGALLAAAGVLSTARFSRPSSGYAVFEALNAVGGIGSLILVLSDSGGSLVNALVLDAANENDVLAITVASDGTVTAYVNDIVETINANWLNPVGQTTVGASDKFAPALSAAASGASENSQMTLRTKAADITGSYGAGGQDVCGNAL